MKNILIVSFDDAVAPWPYRNCFGEPLQMPNLDALCEQATVFLSAYAQAPICGPSRASMMSSRLPHQLDILNNSTFLFDRVKPQACWIHDLKAGGYFCSSGGKIHHKPTLKRGHHRKLYSDDRKIFDGDMRLPRELRKRSRSFGGHRLGRGTVDGTDDAFFFDHQVADSAIEFLDSYQGDQPFYREVGFYSPHGPFITPARFKEAYDATNLRPPGDWAGYVADSPHVIRNIPENTDLRDLDYWQKSVRNYFSAYSHGDYHLGRVLAALRASRHADNTIVVVLSDHGFHLGNRNLFRKSTLWEQTLHVPLIIHDPSRKGAQVITDPVALVDVGPTLLDLAGLACPEMAAGRSLRPMMEEGSRDPDRIIPSFYGRILSIRKGDYRLIRYAGDDLQLFDLRSDYWQLRDLGRDHPAFAPMLRAMDDWAASVGYSYPEPEADPALAPADEEE